MTAESQITALESLPLGEAWSEAHRAAEAAIATERDAAIAALFPAELAPTTADAIAEYTWRTSRLGAAGYGERLAEMHGRALASHPALARLLRSHDAIADVEAAAIQVVAPSELETFAAAQAHASGAARMRYQLAIARQLAAVDGQELQAAAHAMLACEDLERRFEGARRRHEASAQLELERVAEEQRATRRAVTAEQARLVDAATARAAEAAAEAARAANDARLARAEALKVRLRDRLERASRSRSVAERLELEHLRTTHTLHDVGSIILDARAMSSEQLARFTAILDRDER